jgi:hypothetical protein
MSPDGKGGGLALSATIVVALLLALILLPLIIAT